jgi:hypothetical protein
VAAADGYGKAPKLRIIPLLHRRVEGVHVHMDDLADTAGRVGNHHDFLAVAALVN